MVTFGLREEGCGQASGAADSALLCLTWCLLAQHLHHGRGSLGLVGSLVTEPSQALNEWNGSKQSHWIGTQLMFWPWTSPLSLPEAVQLC